MIFIAVTRNTIKVQIKVTGSCQLGALSLLKLLMQKNKGWGGPNKSERSTTCKQRDITVNGKDKV